MKINVLKLMFRDFMKSHFMIYVYKILIGLIIATILTPIIVYLFNMFGSLLPYVQGQGEFISFTEVIAWQFSSSLVFFGSMVAAAIILILVLTPIFIVFMALMLIITKVPRIVRWKKRMKELYEKYDEELNG